MSFQKHRRKPQDVSREEALWWKLFEEFRQARIESCGHNAVGDNESLAYFAWTSHNWGNLLSEYWEVRGLAALSGREYLQHGTMADSFLQFLPAHAPAYPELTDLAAHKAACDNCQFPASEFPHSCEGAWTKIRSIVQEDTQLAIRRFEETQAQKLPDPQNEALVQLRLEFRHPQVRWPGRSCFKNRLHGFSKVTVLHMPYTDSQVHAAESAGHIHQQFPPDRQENITVLLNGYREIIQEACGGCKVEFASGSQYQDFARLVRNDGPVLCMGSSYCLWAAYANTHGPTYFPAYYFGGGRQPAVAQGAGAGFVWNDAQYLSPDRIENFELMGGNEVVQWAKEH